MHQLNEKVVLVTGGASGLGLAIAQRLAAERARVVITDIRAEAGETIAAQYGLTFIEQDVTNEVRWGEVVLDIEKRLGALHILVNNAGIVGPMDASSPETTRLTDWRRIFAVNVEGTFLGCRAAIPAIRRAGGGSIVNMSSIAGLVSMPEGIAYGASKAAVRHLTRSVALHCARDGSKIRCNSIHPGNVRTPLLEKAMEGIAKSRGVSFDDVVREFQNESPQREFQDPEDIAQAVLYLVSDGGKHITGAQLVVDGGASLVVG
jgi:3(or 17)beta-hydroxysteroid dehydrogenase